MFETVSQLVRRGPARVRGIAADAGATALEYAILVLMGFIAAGAVAAIVASAISSRTAQIK